MDENLSHERKKYDHSLNCKDPKKLTHLVPKSEGKFPSLIVIIFVIVVVRRRFFGINRAYLFSHNLYVCSDHSVVNTLFLSTSSIGKKTNSHPSISTFLLCLTFMLCLISIFVEMRTHIEPVSQHCS